MTPYVLIEQSEGYMVDYDYGNGVDVFFVDYSECVENVGYAEEKLNEWHEISDSFPKQTQLRVEQEILSYVR